jgi:hypothetical protein
MPAFAGSSLPALEVSLVSTTARFAVRCWSHWMARQKLRTASPSNRCGEASHVQHFLGDRQPSLANSIAVISRE